jgi:hypothetical protein
MNPTVTPAAGIGPRVASGMAARRVPRAASRRQDVPSRIERLFRIIFAARVHATLDSGHSLAVAYDGERDCDSDSADNRHDRNENRENLRTKYLIDQRFVSEQN